MDKYERLQGLLYINLQLLFNIQKITKPMHLLIYV